MKHKINKDRKNNFLIITTPINNILYKFLMQINDFTHIYASKKYIEQDC